jgi:hypothetical protein
MIRQGRALMRTTRLDNKLTSQFNDERLTAGDRLEALFPALSA